METTAEMQRRWQCLAEALRLSRTGTYGWNVGTGDVFWSDEIDKMLGYARETNPTLELALDRIHPDDQARVRQLLDSATQNSLDLDFETRVLAPDGAIKHIHTFAHAARDNEGNLEYIGVATDITESKRADEERRVLSRDLQESKGWLEEAQRVAHVGYWVWDLETNRLIWSDETYRIFGLTPQEDLIDLDKLREMIHPDDREIVFRTAEEAIRSGARADCEHRLLRPNGEMRIVHSLGDLKKDSSGRPLQMFGTTQDITDRKRAEEERQALSRDLQESKTRLEEAQRVAHVGHWEWDLKTDVVVWSDETYRIFGLKAQERRMDLATVRAMVHPEDRESLYQGVDDDLLAGVQPDAEFRIVLPNGEVRTVHALTSKRWSSIPGDSKKDALGRPQKLFGTIQDITERKRVEQALQRTQAHFREGQRLAHMGNWISDGSTCHWSGELYQIYGFDQRSGVPTTEEFLAIIHPQDRASMENAIRSMREEVRGYDVTTRIVRPDGELRYVRCVCVPLVEQGVSERFLGISMDVTEQELVTQELRREQAYLAEAQSLAHIGSWATNFATGQILHISDETVRLYGFDPRQGPVPYERFYATLHPEDEPAVRATLENAIRTRTDYDHEFRICLPDGSIRFHRAIGHRNLSAEPGEYVGVTMDITERKHAEAEHEKLRQLEADLAHFNRLNMMGELAAALAHEIKQPIAASITSANACLRWLARDPPDLERARAAAARIEKDGNRAADVINSLRSFYKKGTSAERQLADVKDIIREMTALLRTEAVRHSVTIHSEVAPDTPKIVADRVQLQQVFMNLMLNAIEAMKDAGGELAIRARPNLEGQLIISISDTGVGLPAENSDRIFDAFHTTKPQGTGMGLAITRSIVESHGGRIWANANQGAGATFHFTLPREAEAHV